MTDAADNTGDPFPNPKNYQANRTAGWSTGASDGTSRDDTLDRV